MRKTMGDEVRGEHTTNLGAASYIFQNDLDGPCSLRGARLLHFSLKDLVLVID